MIYINKNKWGECRCIKSYYDYFIDDNLLIEGYEYNFHKDKDEKYKFLMNYFIDRGDREFIFSESKFSEHFEVIK